MPTLPTYQELYDAARAEVQLRRPDLTDWNEGSNLDAITGGGAVLADEVIRVAVALFRAQFFDTAEGADLDALVQDRFGGALARKPATAALGTVTWTRDAAGAYVILAGTRFRAQFGTTTITVQSLQAVTLLAADTSIEIPVQATVTGRATNAAAGEIDEILDVHVSDPGATCTNAQPLAGGSDAETDEALRDRVRRQYNTLRRATVAALEAGALSVPGVAVVTVDESAVESSGWVYVYVGDPDARSNDTLAALVETELENWRAAGVLVSVEGADRQEKSLSMNVVVERGSDQNAVAAAIRAAVVAYGDSLGPGERVRGSRIEQAAHQASELVVAVDDVTVQGGNAPSASHRAIRFVAESIAIDFSEV